MNPKTIITLAAVFMATIFTIFFVATCGDRDAARHDSNASIAGPNNPCGLQPVPGEAGNACSAHEAPTGVPSRQVELKPVPESAYVGLTPFIGPARAGNADQLAAWDFGPFVDALPDGFEAKGRFADIWDHERATISSSLSSRERKALYGLHVPYQGVLQVPTIELHAFYAENGRLPADAVELARFMSPARFSAEWFREVGTQPAMDQYRKVSQYVNPITGRLYDSFSCGSWEPGGVYFCKLSADPSKEDPHYEVLTNLSKYGKPIPEAWLLRLYGEEQDEVLLETALYFYSCEEWERNQAM